MDNKCKNPKKERPNKDDCLKVNVIEEEGAEISLHMAIEEDDKEVLMQGISLIDLKTGLRYLNTGASGHMIGERELFYEFDNSSKGKVKFGVSKTKIEVRGNIIFQSRDCSSSTLFYVLFTHSLQANILSLGRLDG